MKKTNRIRLALSACLLLLPGIAAAGGSAPILSLSRVTPASASSGARALVVSGSFNFDDLVQFSFPAGLIVTQGSRFVRYDVSGAVVEGTSDLVADGVAVTEIPTLLPLGAAAVTPARVVQLGEQRIMVALPADFAPGNCSAILYAVLDSESFVSNTIDVVLP